MVGTRELAEMDHDDLTVEADRNHLKQVLINLVRNSAESIGQDGRGGKPWGHAS